MSWANNFLSIDKNGEAGSCPYCSSSNTNYYYNPPEGAKISSLYIWCNDCMKAFLGSADRTLPRNKVKPPKGLALG